MIANQNEEKERRNELRDEFQKLSYTVQSVKDVLVKNDDKIGEIVLKIENLVNWDKMQIFYLKFLVFRTRIKV